NVVTALAVNLGKIYWDPRAVATSRQGAFVKRFLVGPVATSDKAARSERNNGNCGGAINHLSPPARHFDCTADEKKKRSDARKVKPMLGHGGIELDDIRYRKVGGKKPNRAKNSKST